MRVKLFRTYALFLSIVILTVMVLLGLQIRGKNQAEAINAMQEELRGDVRAITTMFDSMEDLSRQINASETLLDCFEAADADGDAGNWFDAHPDETQAAGQILDTLNSIGRSALRISVYNLKGDFISRGELDYDADTVRSFYEDLTDMLAYQYVIVERNGGAFAVSGPHPDFWLKDDPDQKSIVSFLAYLKDPMSGGVYGLVDIQYDIADFTSLPFFSAQDGRQTLLFDDWGRSGFIAGEEEELESFYARIQAAFDETGDYVMRYREDGRSWIAIGVKEYKSNWTLVRVAPLRLLDARYTGVYVGFAICALVLLGVLVYTVWAISRMLARPLDLLADSISRVGIQHMEPLPALPARYTSLETVHIQRTFNQMLARLNSSIDLEMKAYLKALQSQMNPHFLYNCLDIIADAAEENGSVPAARMCERLAVMLRYRANYASDFVPLREEIGDICNYMEMMKARYDGRFSYVIDVPEALDALTVPHVILQPLVENCFKHGFMRSEGPWQISVQARQEGSRWSVSILDNGAGMTEEELAAMRAKLEQSRENIAENYSKLRIGGMGLVNTYMRLALMSRGDITMNVSSPEGGGTQVTIGGAL